MPTPPDNLERKFDKDIYTAHLQADIRLGEQHELTSGVGGEYQDNQRGGWGFIIPDFNYIVLRGFRVRPLSFVGPPHSECRHFVSTISVLVSTVTATGTRLR